MNLYAGDCCDVCIGTKASAARHLAESIIGGMDYYHPDMHAAYLFETVGDAFIYIRVGRRDSKKIGKREARKITKQIEAMI